MSTITGPEGLPTDDVEGGAHSAGGRKGARRAVLLLVGLLVLGLLALFGVLAAFNSKLNNNVERADLLPGQSSSSPVENPLDKVTVNEDGTITDANGTTYESQDGSPIRVPMAAGSGREQTISQPTRPASAGTSQNFLVIGSDSRGGERGRSDVMLLAHVSDDRKRVDLVHFPRDLWTQVPGYGANKLNAAYAYGGAPKLVETIQPMIGVPIDHVAMVDFEGFKAMTDAIGGVDLEGQHMDGEQALTWVRERKTLSQGDISRGQRQMVFAKAVLGQALSPDVLGNPAKLNRYLDAGTSAVTVDQDFTTAQMRSLMLEMRGLRSEGIATHSAPWSGVGMAGAQSIVVPAPEQMVKLKTALQNDSMAKYVDNVSPTQGFGR